MIGLSICMVSLLFITTTAFGLYEIQNLDRNDEVYEEFTTDILNMRLKFNLRRSYTNDEFNQTEAFPPLKFALYEIQEGDDLFNITSRMYLSLDTLISLNCLASVADLETGQKILISNMRGIIYKAEEDIDLTTIGDFYRVDPTVIKRANNLTSMQLREGEEVFVPGGFLTTEEWSYFNSDVFEAPLDGRVSSNYGYRNDPFTNRRTFHGGIDIAAPQGSAVRASKDGKVIYTGYAGGYGNLIILQHDFGYQSYYGHLSSILVENGDQIESGQLIGQVGSTGRSTGPHLHFEIRRDRTRENPLDHIDLNHSHSASYQTE